MIGKIRGCLLIIVVFSFIWQSCYRNDITFGNLPDNNYTNVAFTDTVAPSLSTVILDSFPTGSATTFLLGKYKDPYLGVISTRPYFQMTIPDTSLNIPLTARYDSFCFVIHPNRYYYGDTTRAQTITINEVSEPIYYTYNTNLFNTSSFAVSPVELGHQTLKIRPNVDDSIIVRLNDAKGLDLYTKIQQNANELASDANFQDYFKGATLSTGSNDTAAVFGLTSAMDMRIFYHTTTPYYQNLTVSFPLKSGPFSFNQILTDRHGTPLFSTTPGIGVFPSEQTNKVAFTQHGAGVLLKITFPSLRDILSTDKILELQKAELIVRPIGTSYSLNQFQLPNSLSLLQTDATNGIGPIVVSNVPPVTDEIYGVGAYYRFDVTSFINLLLTTAGSEDEGFFLIDNSGTPNVTRAVIGDSKQPVYNTQLLLTAVIISK